MPYYVAKVPNFGVTSSSTSSCIWQIEARLLWPCGCCSTYGSLFRPEHGVIAIGVGEVGRDLVHNW